MAPPASAPATVPTTPSTAPAKDGGAPLQLVFQIHSGATDAKTQFRAKLRVKTSDGQTFEYKTPISHANCYFLLSGDTKGRALDSVDDANASLMCAGGGQTDEATVTRISDTLVEVSVFQKAFSGPDTPPAKAINTQTFSIKVPPGARLRTTIEAAPAK